MGHLRCWGGRDPDCCFLWVGLKWEGGIEKRWGLGMEGTPWGLFCSFTQPHGPHLGPEG